MADLFPDIDAKDLPELADVVAEIERELRMRRNNYPRWVSAKRMSQGAADRQTRLMEAARLYLLQYEENDRLQASYQKWAAKQDETIVKLKAVIARLSEESRPPPVKDAKAERDNMGG